MDDALSRRAGHTLLGRHDELAVLDRLVSAVRAGHSGALVVRGEPGIGKSELLRHVIEVASPACRVERAAGVESEMELPYAGLHQLCGPLLDRMDRLPGPQRTALEAAFGLSASAAPDRFFVALAVLGLLSDVAAEQPLVCVVDDAQWLDRASLQTLGFVARRLGVESVALVFAVRERDDELAGLPELKVGGLRGDDARALLSSVLLGPLDRRVADRILAETGGNPLALLELPRGLTGAQLAGGFVVPDGVPLSGRIEENFRRRMEHLPPDARRLLLLAAAEPVGDPALLWRAAARLGIPPHTASVAEREMLMEIGTRVRFRHPLVRSAVYGAASAAERRDVHRALAAATDPEADPDRRAWHRATAVAAPDAAVADELERSAGRAQARGGLAAAAAFLERATALTVDPALRAERALEAAQAKLEAGAPAAALGLLALAEAVPLEELQRARVDRLRGQIAFASSRGADAPRLLLRAAKRLEPLDGRLARETHLDALQAAMVAGALGDRMLEVVARSARAAPRAPGPRIAADLLLDGVAVLFTDGHAAAAPLLERALAETPDETWTRWPWLAAMIAWELWDVETYSAVAERQVALAREAGAITTLFPALSMLAVACVHAGDFEAAQALLDEAAALADVTGVTPWAYARIVLSAWQGRQPDALETIEAAVRDASARGEGLLLAFGELFTAVLHNGLGDYPAALVAARQASNRIGLGFVARALPELVEAAVRSGEPDAAAAALARLRELTRSHVTDWALGVEAYATALVDGDEHADAHFRAAVQHLTRDGRAAYLARAHLLYGQWLRQQDRRREAAQQLHLAHDLFATMGAEAFARRAARELLATGEKVRNRTGQMSRPLTAQEAQIAQLARDGLSNPEIGDRMFISRRTVEYHLAKVFTKLGIRSRRELETALPAHAKP
ncbi:MAG TPA: AAA family ATPase [Baekduia sp.]|uniref:helix-turn-helix transcriptional regulator n=1 Tax=Baekduia sp. TaxID=2600305 RepID=UPI002C411500|nr:AAA family ATPase [Baekduia sp.]HMJ34285.1 AAA family ATPase [Baekduia sp.]